MDRPLVLGIETSCDDTACAVLDGGGRVLASVVSSQLAAHRPYGGVVPEIASREHLANWPAVSGEALERAGVSLRDVDVVAATRGPGLVGALLVGLSIGKAVAFAGDRPFHAVHHLEGHLFSPFLRPPGDPEPPAPPPARFVGLVLSGGHSSLFAVEDGEVSTLGETRDDAIGEVFDKVGKRLGLPYPQGPKVDELAERGTPGAHRLPVSRFGGGNGLDFSYSGLKSQTLLEIERLERALGPIDLGDGNPPPQPVLDLLAGFRESAVGQVLDRLERLQERRPIPLLAVSGGAAANRLLRRELPAWAERHGVELRLVPLVYSGDNAAMIAHAALLRHRRGSAGNPFAAEAESRIPL
ncbi:MAG TPA: tRNA (adenosine(37)-N6)-threonylcarbamoyltransferase complex transferase subunit TsaD [Thermoanaerobaculia bacterium]|jgi:N6-L-threonylcarbamoyladenine synthase|nr:tRNA (adenosine(37)-N6)-threonylcarbamoyltransferase complex transferase subunit TsaD [Thermoanaerobaculia bacterium]